MNKKVLSETPLYYGSVDMPKGFEIDGKKLCQDILDAGSKGYQKTEEGLIYYKNKDCALHTSVQFDMLNRYIIEHVRKDYELLLQENYFYGNAFLPQQHSYLRDQINPMDLLSSPDFTLLYAADVGLNSCKVIVDYDDNKVKGQHCRFQLDNNSFVLFPSNLKYAIDTNHSHKTNFIITCAYTLIR